MCRLLTMAGVDLDRPMKRLLFHQAMLYSAFEGGNAYGSGVSDGSRVYKCGRSYTEFGLDWSALLDADKIWMGHVRRPSKNVAGASTPASHPFVFPMSDGAPLIGAHNGYISDTEYSEDDIFVPDSDSFRALAALADMLNDGATLDIKTFNQWTDDFGPESEWAFNIMRGDDVWILRGNRPMSFMPMARGYIFSTSHEVLYNLSKWTHTFWPGVKIGGIVDIKEYHAIHLQHSQRGLKMEPLEMTYKRYADPTAYWFAYEEGNIESRALPERG